MNTHNAMIIAAAITVIAQSRGFADPPGENPASGESIPNLVRQLGDAKIKVRDAAERELLNRPESVPLLRLAVWSGDAEVVRRATRIARTHLTRAFRVMMDDGVDLFAERFLLMKEPVDVDAGWCVMFELANKFIEHERRLRGHAPEHFASFRKKDLESYLADRPHEVIDRPLEDVTIKMPDPFLVRAQSIKVDSPIFGFFVLARGLNGRALVGGSIMLAADSSRVTELKIGASIIISDGDTPCSDIRNSIMIVRGKIVAELGCISSFIVCTGKFDYRYNVGPHNTIIKDNSPDLLGLVKFFEPAQVGIEVVADGGVKVVKAAEGKPFASAGVKPGDVVLALDGVAAESPDVFRRTLRKRVALGGMATLTVRREGREIESMVPFKSESR